MTDGRPSGYRIVTPPDWWRIDLEPGRRAAAVDAVVRRTLPADDQPQLRRTLVARLEAQAAAAYDAGGVELYLSTLRAGPLPLSSSLVVSYLPGSAARLDPDTPGSEELAELAHELAHRESAVQVVGCEVREVGRGQGIRRVSRLLTTYPSSEDDTGDAAPPTPSTEVDWFLPVPHGNGAMLLLAYSTPMVTLEAAMVDLFDTVTATLRWTA